MRKSEVFEFEDGAVRVWVEQESIHLLAHDLENSDPVELTSDTARQLAQRLNELADLMDK